MLKTKISTTKLDEMVAFYARVFGLTEADRWDSPGDKGVILKFPDGAGQALLEIYHTEQAHDFSGLSLQFKVDDVKAFAAALPDDIAFDGPTPRPWGATYVYLRDPENIQVIVYEGCV